MKFYIYKSEDEFFIVPGKLENTDLGYVGYIGEYDTYNQAKEMVEKYGLINLVKEEAYI